MTVSSDTGSSMKQHGIVYEMRIHHPHKSSSLLPLPLSFAAPIHAASRGLYATACEGIPTRLPTNKADKSKFAQSLILDWGFLSHQTCDKAKLLQILINLQSVALSKDDMLG